MLFSVRPVMGAFLMKIRGFNYVSCRLKSSSDMAAFRELVKKARHIVAITGAGISAESGVPTYRGAGALWRTYHAQELDTAGIFSQDPSLVWEFYHFRRELVLSKQPNKAHVALAKYENYMEENGRKLTLITQNIDGLHQRAGSKDVTELHGSIFKTRCTKCGYIVVNMDNPICPALAGKGSADMKATAAKIPESELPRCKRPGCGGLLRPHVVWFGEALDPDVLSYADEALEDCDLCLVIGTSSVVYPAALFAPRVAQKGVPVAEFNLEETAASYNFHLMQLHCLKQYLNLTGEVAVSPTARQATMRFEEKLVNKLSFQYVHRGVASNFVMFKFNSKKTRL